MNEKIRKNCDNNIIYDKFSNMHITVDKRLGTRLVSRPNASSTSLQKASFIPISH